ncbi:MAG: dihydrofolate reductase [Pseudomonadota bacterium]
MVELCHIVALARNSRAIGMKGNMPWHIPAELGHFKAVTMNKPLVMGRKTFDSIGRALPGRTSFVVSRRQPFLQNESVIWMSDLDSALEAASKKAKQTGSQQVMIIGGEEIFRQSMPHTDRIIASEVDLDVEGDAFYPALNDEWRLEKTIRSVPAKGAFPAYTINQFIRTYH